MAVKVKCEARKLRIIVSQITVVAPVDYIPGFGVFVQSI